MAWTNGQWVKLVVVILMTVYGTEIVSINFRGYDAPGDSYSWEASTFALIQFVVHCVVFVACATAFLFDLTPTTVAPAPAGAAAPAAAAPLGPGIPLVNDPSRGHFPRPNLRNAHLVTTIPYVFLLGADIVEALLVAKDISFLIHFGVDALCYANIFMLLSFLGHYHIVPDGGGNEVVRFRSWIVGAHSAFLVMGVFHEVVHGGLSGASTTLGSVAAVAEAILLFDLAHCK